MVRQVEDIEFDLAPVVGQVHDLASFEPSPLIQGVRPARAQGAVAMRPTRRVGALELQRYGPAEFEIHLVGHDPTRGDVHRMTREEANYFGENVSNTITFDAAEQ